MFLVIEAKVLPGGAYRGRARAEIEEGEELCVAARSGLLDGGAPDADIFKARAQHRSIYGTAVTGVLIDKEDGLIGDERTREVVEAREVAAEDERRTRYGPERELGALLVLCFARLSRLAPSGVGPEPAFREHVGVGPTAGAGVHEPFRQAIEFAHDSKGPFITGLVGKTPSIPVVVGNAPHLRVLRNLGRVSNVCGAWREAQNNGAAGFADGFGDLADLCGPVRIVGDAVDLEKIQAPMRIKLQHGVVVGLACGIVLDAPVALIPGAGRCGVGGVGGMELRACDGQIGCDHLLGNATHDVNAKLQSLRVQPIGERLESGAIGGRRIARRDGNQKAVAVPEILFLFEGLARGIGHVPALVDDGIFPPELLERN